VGASISNLPRRGGPATALIADDERLLREALPMGHFRVHQPP